ncbi:MAG: DUF805 domain-containing protein [Dinoroseobacter sp.]|nr:DUF805 domain-containing protein [Dinoroseobacter sp.]
MSFTQSIRTCFSKYVTFSGRASRPEYWYFFLFVFVGGMLATLLDVRLFPGSVEVVETAEDEHAGNNAVSSGPLSLLFSLVTFLPLLAAGWRRMHDSGRSGLHLVYPLIVMIGTATFAAFGLGLAESFGETGTLLSAITAVILFFALLVLIVSPLLVLWWLSRPTQAGVNQYGPDPHGGTA